MDYREENLMRLKQKIQQEIMNEIDAGLSFTDNALLEFIEKKVLEYDYREYVSVLKKQWLVRSIFNSLRRLDVLQDLLEDDEITEIMINGPNHIFIEKDGRISRCHCKFQNLETLENVIQQMVAKVNRAVNEASPIVDFRIPENGARVNVVLPPVALNGPVVTIRKFPKHPFTMEGLIEKGALTKEVAQVLKKLVAARYNIFISGGTGSGKTTFLNALSAFIPEEERIITIEDSAELQIQNIPNLVRLEARNANLEGKNQVTIRDLVKSALRQRPDRIIIGEIRDSTAVELLNAMNTGHDGSLSTGHGNSTGDMLRRIATMYLMGMDIPLSAIRSQIASALDIVIQLGRLRDKSRKVLEIDEVLGIKNGEIELNPLYVFQEEKNRSGHTVKGKLVPTKNCLQNTEKLVRAGIEWEEGP